MKNANKRFKEEIITQGLGEFSYKRIPFTSPRMNYCTFGGIPIGKITEFYGEEHGGKTTTALDIVANYQHSGDDRDVLYVDAENTLDTEWARKIGVDVDKMYILQPKSQSAEEIFQIICDSVDTGEVGLWVLDSIGVLMSAQEWEKTLEDKTYAGISKPLTQFSKRVESLMARHHCTGIGINQMRDVIGSMFPMQTTPGGKAWKHCCAVRMQFSRGKFIDADGKELSRGAENPAGNIVMMSMTKNKTCPPTRRTGFYTINYEMGIDYLRDLIEVAIKYDIVRKSGAWFDIVDIETGEIIEGKIHGQAAVYELLNTNDQLLEKVENLVDKVMKEN
jgi:recombination protein RecA